VTWLPPEISTLVAVGLVVVSFLASLLTVAAGLGGGTVMLASIASTLPPAAVIPVHAVIQVGSNGGRALLMTRHVVKPVLVYFAAGAVVGAIVGGQLYVNLPGYVLKLVLGVFILYAVWGPKLRKTRVAHRGFALVGLVTTFLTMFVGGTGPFLAAFINPERFGKDGTVATHGACMTFQHGFKALVFGALGFAYAPWLFLMLAMVAAGFLGTLAGRAVLMRLPEQTFKLIFRVALTILALRLLWSAVVEMKGAMA
jgi:uncharacterized membrane protein YfcA